MQSAIHGSRSAVVRSRIGLMIVLAMAAATLVVLPASRSDAQTGDLIISEIIEGSSFNKAIEIYNGTGAGVDLSTYSVELYSNGAGTPSQSVTLMGTLDDGDVFVIAHASADAAILAVTDLQSSAVANFNGDDAVVLQGAGGVVDAFGQVGFDPGSEWPGGGQDDTLVRNADVCLGDTNATDAFDASVEWTVHPQNDFSFLGSHTANCDVGNQPVVAVCDAPLVTDLGVAATAALSASDTDGTVVDIAAAVDPAPASGSIAVANLVPAGGVGGTATADLVVDAGVPAGDYTVTVTASNDDAEAQTDDCVQQVTVVAPAVAVGIHEVQGDGSESPLIGQRVIIEGVVVGDYEGPSPELRGFYVQEQDDDTDSNPATSEGVFVFHGDEDTVALGDTVTVTGTVGEFQGQTQLGFPESVVVDDMGATVTAVPVTLPLASPDALERHEGMLVTFPQPLHVTEFFQLGRFGQVVVSSGDRLDQPTAIAEPGAAANAIQAANDLNRVIIDDDLNNQNPDPILFGRGGDELTAQNTLRGGDTVTGAVGVMTYTWAGNSASGNAYRLRVVGDLSDSGLVPGGVVPEFAAVNPRPAAAPDVGGDRTVASFNVLNYFVTLDDGGEDCGPTGFPQECRGANDAEELERQRQKLVAALLEIDADVIGLVELENSEGVSPLADIVGLLNAALGSDDWDYIDTGTIGTDVIKVGIIYKPGSVTPVGGHSVLDGSVDPRFDDDLNRPTLAQSFTGGGETFTVVVNHLKSKSCTDATGDDMDQGDGQGCYNAARSSAAEALADWVNGDPTDVGDTDSLIIGDLNSYAREDPIDVLAAAGFTDLATLEADPYSYVFDGQWGYLDYAMASSSMLTKVTGAAEYHINADEPSVLDYNTDFKTDRHVDILFAPDEFRTSDHDPVIVGIDTSASCEPDPPVASATADPSILAETGELVPVTVTLEVTDASDFTVELLGVTVNQSVRDVEVQIVDDTHFLLRAKREGRAAEGRIYTITYLATDVCGNETVFSTDVSVPRVRNQPR